MGATAIKLVLAFVVVCSQSVESTTVYIDKYEALFQRFAELEAKDAARKAEMRDMKNKMDAMDTEFSQKMANLEMMSLKNGVSGKEDTRRAVSRTPIAFYSFVSQQVTDNIPAGQRIIFDSVHTNLGNAYHNQSGLFIAPIPGTYVISVTVSGRMSNSSSSFFTINVNNDVRAKLICHMSTLTQNTNTLVLQLNPGDSVYVAVPPERQNGILGIYYSTFSGFLLYEN